MRIDLKAPVTLEGLGAATAEFWNWWRSELLALLPPALRATALRSFAACRMEQRGLNWVFSWPGSDSSDLAIETSLPDAAFRNALRRLGGDAFGRPVTLVLPAHEVLFRNLRLPAAAGARLRSAIALQLERLSPFRSDDVIFDWRQLEHGEPGEIAVEVAIVPRATLERYETWVGGVGLRLADFEAGDSGYRFRSMRASWRLDFLRPEVAFALAGVVLWIGALVLAPTLRERELAHTTARVEHMRAAAGGALQAKMELDRLSAPLAFLQQSASAPAPLDVLRDVTVLLPDSVHLSHFLIEGNHLEIGGTAARLQPLIQRLQRSGRFQSVKSVPGRALRVPGGGQFALELTLRSPTAEISQ